MNIEQIANSILIAEFMGIEQIDIDTWLEDNSELQYHKNWNWLMNVIERIEQNDLIDVEILQYGTIIRTEYKDIINNVANISFTNKIEHTYDAVIKYIKQI
jgi:hypothetical protein